MEEGKRVTWPGFCFSGLGLSLGAKFVSTNDRPSNSSIIFRLFPSGGKKKNCAAFRRGKKKNCAAFCMNRLEVRTPRHVWSKFRAKNRRSDPLVFIVKQNLARKLDPRLQPSNLREITYLANFYAQRAKCPRRF